MNTFLVSEMDDLMLQMDIEEGEYHALINTSDILINKFRIIVIEFYFLEDLWNLHFFNLAESVFDKILNIHICVHIHPNNHHGIETKYGIDIPKIAEFTFLRKDRVGFLENKN